MTTGAVGYPQPLEDPLSYLPCSNTEVYRPGQIIYAQGQPQTEVCVIIDGYVKVSREVPGGGEIVIDVYGRDDLFGESALLGGGERPEKATTLTRAAVMTWSAELIEELILRRPRLGIALAQLLAARDAEFIDRIESMAVESASVRLARALLRFGGRLGERADDATLRMPPLTHELLAETIGTSREVVTGYMAELRRNGYVRYSRRGIQLYDGPLKEWIRHNAREGLVTRRPDVTIDRPAAAGHSLVP